ncbi:hypothetical protein F0562_003804 [Nyssa sinensis]|uniref:Aminoglycoside phosphotransferase domain-containing protein n=1 Tax=Nyssa sinensis TaxID=561372 RepID=A0A5J5C0A9_9ASTE|nr:hypothetical protein F0562_003804 [Nyssa sinensis]
MLELVDWLRQHIPLEDSSGATTGLVHGDFRIDNLVFHPIEVICSLKNRMNWLSQQQRCLYGLIHVRYILTRKGMAAMVLLGSELIKSSSEERSLLKNQGMHSREDDEMTLKVMGIYECRC